MTPPNALALWRLGYSVTTIAQLLTRKAGHDVSVGSVCTELWRAGITQQAHPQPPIRRPDPRVHRPMGERR